MKLHNGEKVLYTVKNGEKQGDNNSVDYFIVQLHVNNCVATDEPVRKKFLGQTQANVSCHLVYMCF